MSQEEVEELLKGVTGEFDEADPSNAFVCGLDRYVHGRMPFFERSMDKAAQALAGLISSFLGGRTAVAVSTGPSRLCKYREFLRNEWPIRCPRFFKIAALGGPGLAAVWPELAAMATEALFGGAVESRESRRSEIGSVEDLVADRLSEMLLRSLDEPISQVAGKPVRLCPDRPGADPRFDPPAEYDEIVVYVVFHVELGDFFSSAMSLCIPYRVLEPIRDRLRDIPGPVDPDDDGSFARRVEAAALEAPVELAARVGSVETNFAALAALRPGDVLPMKAFRWAELDVAGGALVLLGEEVGEPGGRRKIRIIRGADGASVEERFN